MKLFCKALIILFSALFISDIYCMEKNIYAMYQPQPLSIVYAPWRESYVNKNKGFKAIQKDNNPEQCIFCNINNNNDVQKDLILYRGNKNLIMLASQPYIQKGIHFLIVPYEHVREISDLSQDTYEESNILTQKICFLFSESCNEVCINTNQGSSGGASIPNHHHKHIIVQHGPRYYNLIHAMQETKKSNDLKAIFNIIQQKIADISSVIIPKPQQNNCKKNCYYCSIMKKDDRENLIIHRGKYSSAMLSHYPTYMGEIDIIPHDHIESLEALPAETYNEINELTRKMYPLLLKVLKTEDSNIGIISYGLKATDPEHIKQKLIPRKNDGKKSPLTRSNHINVDIEPLYKKLVAEWNFQLFNDGLLIPSSNL